MESSVPDYRYDNPMPESTNPPSQELRILLKFVIQIHRTGGGGSLLRIEGTVSSVADPEEQMNHKKEELRILCFEEVDVLFWGLDASPAARKPFTEA
jgi:hypothetical protein